MSKPVPRVGEVWEPVEFEPYRSRESQLCRVIAVTDGIVTYTVGDTENHPGHPYACRVYSFWEDCVPPGTREAS